MTVRTSAPAKLVAALLMVAGSMAIAAATASATEVIYNNQNTVPVVGAGTEDTFSQCYLGCGYTTAGGIVQFAGTARKLKTVTVDVDSFICQSGSYNLENCTSKPGKKFRYPITVRVYEVTGANERGALLGQQSASAKLPYRPTTNLSCPATEEGKGFGSNCDVGGVLGTAMFKGFSLTAPNKAIIEITSPTPGVNLGFEGAYKEFAGGEFIGIPGSGAPEVGSDPLPEDIFLNGVSKSGFAGYMPVFKVTAK